MYKGKLSLWVVVVCVCFIIQTAFNLIPTLFQEEDITMNFNSSVDTAGINFLNGKKVGDYNIIIDKNNPNIVVTDKDYNSEGYNVIKDYLYTPMVLYVRSSVLNNSEGFILANTVNNEYTPYKFDLRVILDAMEAGKTWKDIGVSSKVAKGVVRLSIPNERSPYYKSVVDLFYLTLNDFNEPTSEDIERLESRVSALLSKCDKVVDVGQEIRNEFEKPSTDYKVFIAPEFLFIRGGSEMTRNNYDAFIPVYFLDTTIHTMDMYYKVPVEGDKTDVVEDFMNYIKEEVKFVKRTGWRLDNVNFSMNDISSSLIDIVPGYNE